MSATKVSPTGTGTTTPRSVRSVLDVVMLVGLFLVVVADGVAQGLEGAIIPPVLVLQALYLLCGVVVATGWRWAMLLPLVVCPLGIVADFASGFPQYTLTHPSSNAVAFGLFVLEYPLLALVIGASASKLVQTRRAIDAAFQIANGARAQTGTFSERLLRKTSRQAVALEQRAKACFFLHRSSSGRRSIFPVCTHILLPSYHIVLGRERCGEHVRLLHGIGDADQVG